MPEEALFQQMALSSARNVPFSHDASRQRKYPSFPPKSLSFLQPQMDKEVGAYGLSPNLNGSDLSMWVPPSMFPERRPVPVSSRYLPVIGEDEENQEAHFRGKCKTCNIRSPHFRWENTPSCLTAALSGIFWDLAHWEDVRGDGILDKIFTILTRDDRGMYLLLLFLTFAVIYLLLTRKDAASYRPIAGLNNPFLSTIT
jgi:hypothetical protein